MTLSGKKLGGSRYGDLALLMLLLATMLLLASTSYDGRIGDRHVRLHEACKGEAAVDMAPLRRELENRLGDDAEDSGGGAIVSKQCVG